MFLGAYLGLIPSTVTVTTGGGAGTITPVESPYTPADPEYVDIVESALARLCEYSRAKTTE